MRPNRQTRRRKGKSDPTDAEAAARAVLSAEAAGSPKAGDDLVEMIRVLRVARGTALKARTQAINALRSLLVTAPPELRDQLRALSTTRLVSKTAQLRPGALGSPLAASKLALRHLACRYQTLEAEISSLDGQLAQLTAIASPQLIGAFGVGADTAGALLVVAGDNPERLRSEAAFSMLCGSSPINASSGKTNRHRLNRGGNRQANAALHRIVLVRMRYHQPTRAYVDRHQRGQEQTRDHALPQTLRRPRGLHRAHPDRRPEARPSRLTSIGASPRTCSGGFGLRLHWFTRLCRP
jgi:transposase